MADEAYLGEWKAAISRNTGALYLAIVEAIAHSIRKGDLQEGEKLPPQRVIATRLGTNLSTVTRAISEAQKRGLLDATIGRGTFVRINAGEGSWRQTDASVIDLTMNSPPLPRDPALQAMIQGEIGAIFRHQDVQSVMSYRVTGGTQQDRQLAAQWLQPVLGRRRAGEILIVPGAQVALSAIMSSLVKPGEAIVTDQLTYPGMRAIAAQLGYVLLGTEQDHEGLIPEALDELCARHRPRVLYCTPTLHNPTTATWSVDRREAVLAIARRHQVQIVEDDPYSLLLKAPPPTLAMLDPSRVLYVATLSKVLSPGLRTAYIVLPGAEMTRRITAGVRAICQAKAGLLDALVSRWIETGLAQHCLRSIRDELTQRHQTLRQIMGARVADKSPSPHVWLPLPEWWSSADFVAFARRQGLALVPSSVFAVNGPPPAAVRMALGSAPDLAGLRESLISLRSVLDYRPAIGFSDIV
ncbi:GntR family transcriptional regulator [Asaia sp. W19]|uniref:aminotransferase-like domain-containing protein n=1 Tax=unclassified Asaia TaxID=2685023 RepID=UPI000F8E2444|nr:PLP-dependent aminotransferase family protein [Asaia sp. W19]RUT24901.1 GntR family transcriptional regulator [Asaia sp. W19]